MSQATQNLTSTLLILNPAVGPVSERRVVGNDADGVFSAASEHIIPSALRLLSPNGQQIDGSYFEVKEDFVVQGNGQTHFLRKGELLVYSVGSQAH